MMDKKRADEKALRDRVNASPELKAKYGDAWDQVAAARAALPPYNAERVFFESGLGIYTQYFTHRAHAGALGEREHQAERRSACRNTRMRAKPRSSGRWHRTRRSIPGVEQAKPRSLARGDAATCSAPTMPLVTQILAGKSPQARATELVAGTKTGRSSGAQSALRRRQGGGRGIDRSLHRAGALVEPRARELRTRYDNEVLAVERDAYAKIAQAVFATQGDAAYPDGTFTLRLSYGQVKGYPENGKTDRAIHRIPRAVRARRPARQQAALQDPDSWMKARAPSIRPRPSTSSAPTTSSAATAVRR